MKIEINQNQTTSLNDELSHFRSGYRLPTFERLEKDILADLDTVKYQKQLTVPANLFFRLRGKKLLIFLIQPLHRKYKKSFRLFNSFAFDLDKNAHPSEYVIKSHPHEIAKLATLIILSNNSNPFFFRALLTSYLKKHIGTQKLWTMVEYVMYQGYNQYKED